ncbi:patatin-like phospholipase domain-containing protein [Synechococcus sp. CS-1328]|uniref:patatin-like phospholipase domain-containing protein n=1 Tax=Synechococcus sp. CS-1328 TaxID=2847976 RepID=UPI00223A7315|nr:patatin-like phospholipase domain-containing protein [Synechococcus sp. CS-1328]MCT0224227.1 patatin-like phospholipase family protein [Synechococcus sp. CS-1328]
MSTELVALLADALSGSGLFGGLAPERIMALGAQHGSQAEGTVLFRKGDVGQHAYLIISGILGLHTGDISHPTAFFRKVVPGELVGEYGPICGEPRSATALALTAVEYLQLNHSQLKQLLQEEPTVQSRFISSLAVAASIGRNPGQAALETIVIHDASPNSPLTATVRGQLPDQLRRFSSDISNLDGLAIHIDGCDETTLHSRMVEATHKGKPQVLFNQDPRAISRRNLLLIDRLLILCDGNAPSIVLPEAMDRETLLVRLWPSHQECPSSRDWARSAPFAQVLNVRPQEPRHLERLARAVVRRQNVLVLGGGGARGFAHIGVLAAMEKLGMNDLDMVMGVSIGSLVASLAAFENTAAEIFSNLERVIIKARPYSFTLPRDSLLTLRNSRLALERFFGTAQMQDSWLPLRCFSTNLSNNRLQAWSSGEIPKAVIASMSVPGIFPPMEDAQGDLHVDGGILNNLPVAEARKASDGRVLAVSLDPDPDAVAVTGDSEATPPRERPSIGRMIINAMMCGSHAETQAQERLADLILRPDIGRFPFLEWKRYREIYAVGYQDALRVLSKGWPGKV